MVKVSAQAMAARMAMIPESVERNVSGTRRAVPWARLYRTARWLHIRADQLARFPLCAMCLARGVVTPANTCDHVEPHRGSEAKFFAGPFQSLCASCHSTLKQAEEQASLQQRGVWD